MTAKLVIFFNTMSGVLGNTIFSSGNQDTTDKTTSNTRQSKPIGFFC